MVGSGVSLIRPMICHIVLNLKEIPEFRFGDFYLVDDIIKKY